jgi:hypothetical protein
MDRFLRGATRIREAIHGADAGVISRPGPEGWSIRDILVHLADAELVRSVRIRFILAEDEPPIALWDNESWKRRLHYIWRSPEASIALFDQLRFTMMEILRQLDMRSWEKAGILPDGERLTVGQLIVRGADHSDEHAAQIRGLRGL